MQDAVMTLDELAMGDDTKHAGVADLNAGAACVSADYTAALLGCLIAQRFMACTSMRSYAHCGSWRLTALPSAATACAKAYRAQLTFCIAGCSKATPQTTKA